MLGVGVGEGPVPELESDCVEAWAWAAGRLAPGAWAGGPLGGDGDGMASVSR